MPRALQTFVAAVALSISGPVAAATLIVDGNGELAGATGVVIDGGAYDVLFVDGTCAAIFSGCDSAADFDFTDLPSATAAAQALLDQVFIGQFDADHTLTLGCEQNVVSVCRAMTPYQFVGGAFYTSNANNFDGDPDLSGGQTFGPIDYNSSLDRTNVWADFTPSQTPVPEPGAWAMMLLGFGTVGGALRHGRRKRRVSESFAGNSRRLVRAS